MFVPKKLEGFENKKTKDDCYHCGEKITELFKVQNGKLNMMLRTTICRNPDCSSFIRMKQIRKEWRPNTNKENNEEQNDDNLL